VSAFSGPTRAALLADGWRIIAAPAGLTLEGMRAAGAPFKGSKYFQSQASQTQAVVFTGGDVAYRPGLLPGSLNRTYQEAEELVAQLRPRMPAGVEPAIGPAALYVWLLVEHHRQQGEWLLSGCYTWAADRAGDAHLAVGVFGRQRPLLVSPIPEGSGRGIGVLPLILPA
jgi:hypothetical protein